MPKPTWSQNRIRLPVAAHALPTLVDLQALTRRIGQLKRDLAAERADANRRLSVDRPDMQVHIRHLHRIARLEQQAQALVTPACAVNGAIHPRHLRRLCGYWPACLPTDMKQWVASTPEPVVHRYDLQSRPSTHRPLYARSPCGPPYQAFYDQRIASPRMRKLAYHLGRDQDFDGLAPHKSQQISYRHLGQIKRIRRSSPS